MSKEMIQEVPPKNMNKFLKEMKKILNNTGTNTFYSIPEMIEFFHKIIKQNSVSLTRKSTSSSPMWTSTSGNTRRSTVTPSVPILVKSKTEFISPISRRVFPLFFNSRWPVARPTSSQTRPPASSSQRGGLPRGNFGESWRKWRFGYRLQRKNCVFGVLPKTLKSGFYFPVKDVCSLFEQCDFVFG